MTIPNLSLNSGLAMTVTNPKHIANPLAPTGAGVADAAKRIGAESVLQSEGFGDVMLRALDKVSGDQQRASGLIQAAITDPDSVDIHDVTIAQAEASMSLNITRTILNRLVQDWKDIINTR
ncbi:MAG: flagellar hook-basal body complex protein FliE [Treponema sp.]|jgi:flagellar hook-basal body complex protein FliE|nr:flagellar hook-basal body complex protein FliE [Treponema sp.]